MEQAQNLAKELQGLDETAQEELIRQKEQESKELEEQKTLGERKKLQKEKLESQAKILAGINHNAQKKQSLIERLKSLPVKAKESAKEFTQDAQEKIDKTKDKIESYQAAAKQKTTLLDERIKDLSDVPPITKEFSEVEKERIQLLAELIELELSDMMIKAYAVSRGLATANDGTIAFGGKILNGIAALIPVPYAATILSGIAAVANSIENKRKEKRAANITSGLTGSEEDKISINDLARAVNVLSKALIYRYAYQATLIDAESAEAFARILVARCTDFINGLNGFKITDAATATTGSLISFLAKNMGEWSSLQALTENLSDSTKILFATSGVVGEKISDLESADLETADDISQNQFLKLIAMSTSLDEQKSGRLGNVSKRSDGFVTFHDQEKIIASDLCTCPVIARKVSKETPDGILTSTRLYQTTQLQEAKEKAQMQQNCSPFGYVYSLPGEVPLRQKLSEVKKEEGREEKTDKDRLIEFRTLPKAFVHPLEKDQRELVEENKNLKAKLAKVEARIQEFEKTSTSVVKGKIEANEAFIRLQEKEKLFTRTKSNPDKERIRQLEEELEKLRENEAKGESNYKKQQDPSSVVKPENKKTSKHTTQKESGRVSGD